MFLSRDVTLKGGKLRDLWNQEMCFLCLSFWFPQCQSQSSVLCYVIKGHSKCHPSQGPAGYRCSCIFQLSWVLSDRSSQQYCEVGKAGIIILILQNRKLDAERLSDLAKVTQMACNRITGFEYTPSDFKFHICSITTSKQKLIISIQQRCWPFLVLKVYTMELSRKIS